MAQIPPRLDPPPSKTATSIVMAIVLLVFCAVGGSIGFAVWAPNKVGRKGMTVFDMTKANCEAFRKLCEQAILDGTHQPKCEPGDWWYLWARIMRDVVKN
jgi:hypothetical protein